MRVLVTGAGGQVARALERLKPAAVELSSLGHSALDIGDAAAVERAVTASKHALIINAAAYTAVDKAEN